MNIFQKIFKRNKNKEELNAMTLEEIKKAYAELSEEDKEAFKASMAEKPAEPAPEPEAEAEPKPAEPEAEEPAPAPEATPEPAPDEFGARLEKLEAAVLKLSEVVSAQRQEPKPASDDQSTQLDRLTAKYNTD